MSFVGEFRKFAMRGNVVDLAIGFTVGAAFTTIARSLVDDILMPPLGLLLGRTDFSDRFILLRSGPEAAAPYATLADANAAGAVTLNYGLFVNALFAFLLVALAMFVVIKAINRIDRQLERDSGAGETDKQEPDSKKCPFCLSTIPHQATRCPQCTSELAGARKVGPSSSGAPAL
jgi:large conductance mechanosensitive channel